jgi:hypothetical protein
MASRRSLARSITWSERIFAQRVSSYPLNQADRLEFEAEPSTRLSDNINAVNRASADGRLLSRSVVEDGELRDAAEAALPVRDTAVYGLRAPSSACDRAEVASTFGELSVMRVMLDHRRYDAGKPYTVAIRAVHLGHWGTHAQDERQIPTFLGSRIRLRLRLGLDCRQRGADCGVGGATGSRLLVETSRYGRH